MTAIDSSLLVASGALGAVVGSFLNVVIYRLPRGEFLSRGSRSVCPGCGEKIASYHNIPIFGWLWLRGTARCCGAPISVRYLMVEALTAGLFMLLWQWPPSGLAFPEEGALALFAFLLQAYFLANLVSCSFIDVDHRILPDRLTKSGMLVGCLGAFALPEAFGQFGIRGLSLHVDSALFSITGLLVGFGVTQLVLWIGQRVFRKAAMGFGDVKFMAMMGAFLGWEDVLLTFFLGCVLGAIAGVAHRLRTGDAYIYFGPFLAMGGAISLFLGKDLKGLLVAYQDWQRTSPEAPWVTSVAAGVSLVLLIWLVRRGRAH